MTKLAITKRAVDAARPTGAEYVVWDDTLSGFGLKVTPAGAKVYFYRYRLARPGQAAQTSPSKYTIGKHGNLTPEQARKRAKELAALVEAGVDPRKTELARFAAEDEAERVAAEQTRIENELVFEKVAARWLDHYENEKSRRPSSVALAKLVVNRHLSPKLAGKPMPRIGRTDIQLAIDAIPAKRRGIRRAVFAYSSILFGWAHKRGDIDANPVTAMAKPEAPKARDRVLRDDELAAVWNAADKLGTPFVSFFRMLILTGQRRSEVAGMQWIELDRPSATWTIPAARAKNGAAHIVPLSPEVVADLDALASAKHDKNAKLDAHGMRWPKSGLVLTTTGRTPISGMTKAKNALDDAVAKARLASGGSALEPWRTHDLRRTMATGFQRLGVRFEVTEATLNHVSGAKGGVAGIYQRHDWQDEKRVALEAWARHVGMIIARTGQNSVVVMSQSTDPSDQCAASTVKNINAH
jgi:integrase